MKRILILGKQSPIAVAIYELILKETDWKVLFELDNYKLDNTANSNSIVPIYYEKKSIRKIVLETNPNYIINCLSIDNINFCENNKKEAWDYNYGIIEALSKASFMTESKLIFFSTDNIFDGINGPFTESDKPKPINYYGKIKLSCENHCISNNTSFISIRLPEYYGSNNSEISNIFYNIINKINVELATNIYTNPILLDDIALGVVKLIDKDKSGIYNFSGKDYISEYDYGRKISDYLFLNSDLIIPYEYDSEKANVKRLVNGGLVNFKSEIDLSMNFVNLHSGLTTVRYQINYNS